LHEIKRPKSKKSHSKLGLNWDCLAVAFIAFLNRAEWSQYIGFSFTAKKKKKPLKLKPMHCKFIMAVVVLSTLKKPLHLKLN
jgi:hypothetical protein